MIFLGQGACRRKKIPAPTPITLSLPQRSRTLPKISELYAASSPPGLVHLARAPRPSLLQREQESAEPPLPPTEPPPTLCRTLVALRDPPRIACAHERAPEHARSGRLAAHRARVSTHAGTR